MRASVFRLSVNRGQPLGGTSQQARETARTLGEQALALDPGHGLALGVITLVRTLERGSTASTQSFAEGLQRYTKALERDPNNLDLRNWRGRHFAWAGRFEAAEADFRRCREIEPIYAPCRLNLAIVLFLQGRRVDASAELAAAAAKGATLSESASLLLAQALDQREAFYFIANAMQSLRGFYAFDELYDALGKPKGDYALLRSRLAALQETGSAATDIPSLQIALGDHEERVSIAAIWLPIFADYRQSAAFKASVIDGGLLAYWQAEGFPPQCKPLGTDDFECE